MSKLRLSHTIGGLLEYSDSQPRDDNGRWSGGTQPGEHLKDADLAAYKAASKNVPLASHPTSKLKEMAHARERGYAKNAAKDALRQQEKYGLHVDKDYRHIRGGGAY